MGAKCADMRMDTQGSFSTPKCRRVLRPGADLRAGPLPLAAAGAVDK